MTRRRTGSWPRSEVNHSTGYVCGLRTLNRSIELKVCGASHSNACQRSRSVIAASPGKRSMKRRRVEGGRANPMNCKSFVTRKALMSGKVS
jgi:hypothetical protein